MDVLSVVETVVIVGRCRLQNEHRALQVLQFANLDVKLQRLVSFYLPPHPFFPAETLQIGQGILGIYPDSSVVLHELLGTRVRSQRPRMPTFFRLEKVDDNQNKKRMVSQSCAWTFPFLRQFLVYPGPPGNSPALDSTRISRPRSKMFHFVDNKDVEIKVRLSWLILEDVLKAKSAWSPPSTRRLGSLSFCTGNGYSDPSTPPASDLHEIQRAGSGFVHVPIAKNTLKLSLPDRGVPGQLRQTAV